MPGADLGLEGCPMDPWKLEAIIVLLGVGAKNNWLQCDWRAARQALLNLISVYSSSKWRSSSSGPQEQRTCRGHPRWQLDPPHHSPSQLVSWFMKRWKDQFSKIQKGPLNSPGGRVGEEGDRYEGGRARKQGCAWLPNFHSWDKWPLSNLCLVLCKPASRSHSKEGPALISL